MVEQQLSITITDDEHAFMWNIREHGSVLYLGMATEILNLP